MFPYRKVVNYVLLYFAFLPKLESQSYPIATLLLEPLETGDLIKIVARPDPHVHILDRFLKYVFVVGLSNKKLRNIPFFNILHFLAVYTFGS